MQAIYNGPRYNSGTILLCIGQPRPQQPFLTTLAQGAPLHQDAQMTRFRHEFHALYGQALALLGRQHEAIDHYRQVFQQVLDWDAPRPMIQMLLRGNYSGRAGTKGMPVRAS